MITIIFRGLKPGCPQFGYEISSRGRVKRGKMTDWVKRYEENVQQQLEAATATALMAGKRPQPSKHNKEEHCKSPLSLKEALNEAKKERQRVQGDAAREDALREAREVDEDGKLKSHYTDKLSTLQAHALANCRYAHTHGQGQNYRLHTSWNGMTRLQGHSLQKEQVTQRETTRCLLEAIEAQKHNGEEFRRFTAAQDAMRNEERVKSHHADFVSTETWRTIEANRHNESNWVRETTRMQLEQMVMEQRAAHWDPLSY